MHLRKNILITFTLVLMLLLSACQSNQSNTDDKKTSGEELSQGELDALRNPEWSKDAVIYEVNVRQYTEEGTFKAFEENLPRLKELGVEVLWFMPIHPISEKNRKGELGSYYSIKDYKDVNPEFGTLDDFKALVNTAHEMGFKVMLDWVANHTGWDNEWINNKDWYTQNSKGEIVHPPNTDWTDVADLNFENEEMQEAMIDAMKFWVEEVDVDGFRADHANGVPVEFWEKAQEALENVKPVYMLAEDGGDLALLKNAFSVNYGWELESIMHQIVEGGKEAKHLVYCLNKIQRTYPEDTYQMNFTSNHDKNTWEATAIERYGEALNAMTTLVFTVPGVPMIYSGQEADLNKQLAFFEKDVIDWSDLSSQDFYQKLINLKKENQALWNGIYGGSLEYIEATDENVFAFVREKDDNKVIVILNLSPEKVEAELQFGDLAATYDNCFSDSTTTFEATHNCSLEPWEYQVYVSPK